MRFFRLLLRCLFYLMVQFRFASQMWATRPHLGSIFEKLLHRKTFYCLRLVVCSQDCFILMWCFTWNILKLLLGKPPETGSARLGTSPACLGNRNCPWNLVLSLQPSDFEGNCNSSDFLLDFCCSFIVQFDLLRKCGLLAHTSAAFLKNCCTEKLSFACGSYIATQFLCCFHVMFHVKHCF